MLSKLKIRSTLSVFIALLLTILIVSQPVKVNATDSTVTLTEDTTTVLKNPAMGLVLYADNNMGNCFTWSGNYFWNSIGSNYEDASILYIRAPWSLLEPTEGNYAWDNNSIFQDLIQGAIDRGLKLAFCIYVDSTGSYQQATPDWVRQTGASGYYQKLTAGSTAASASISTTAGASIGSIQDIANYNEADSWASDNNLTFPQYITLDYGSNHVTNNNFTLVTHYGATQGITNLDIQHWDGSNWVTDTSNVGITWDKNVDAEESRSISFPPVSATKFRIKVNSANMTWGHFAINELYCSNPTVTGQYWSPYVDDSIFRTKFESFLDAFAQKYNDPDVVDYIDAMGLGWWGEMHHLFPDGYNGDVNEAFTWITNAYKSRFSHVLLGAQFSGDTTVDSDSDTLLTTANGYDIARRNSFGSGSYFPQSAKNELINLFNSGIPVLAENCFYDFDTWTTPWASDAGIFDDLNAAEDQFISDLYECHANTADLRDPHTASWWNYYRPDDVQDLAINLGYRFVPTSLTYSNALSANGALTISSTWKNTGVGRFPNNCPEWNYKYKVAYALLDQSTGEPVYTMLSSNAEPSDWVKGNNYSYTDEASIGSVANGTYNLGVAIVDTAKNNEPAINLALTNSKTYSGWYITGGIVIVATDKARSATASTTAGGTSISNINDTDDLWSWGSSDGITFPQYITLD